MSGNYARSTCNGIPEINVVSGQDNSTIEGHVRVGNADQENLDLNTRMTAISAFYGVDVLTP